MCSFEYIKNIENIIDDILISEDSFIIDSDQFFNNTIVALVVANLADEVLRKYGHAFGVTSNVMLSMNFSNIFNNMQNGSGDEINLNSSSKGMTHPPKNITANNPIVDKSSYINALEISKRMIEIHEQELNGPSSNPSSAFANKA